jgi:hypothetical protein
MYPLFKIPGGFFAAKKALDKKVVWTIFSCTLCKEFTKLSFIELSELFKCLWPPFSPRSKVIQLQSGVIGCCNIMFQSPVIFRSVQVCA